MITKGFYRSFFFFLYVFCSFFYFSFHILSWSLRGPATQPLHNEGRRPEFNAIRFHDTFVINICIQPTTLARASRSVEGLARDPKEETSTRVLNFLYWQESSFYKVMKSNNNWKQVILKICLN